MSAAVHHWGASQIATALGALSDQPWPDTTVALFRRMGLRARPSVTGDAMLIAAWSVVQEAAGGLEAARETFEAASGAGRITAGAELIAAVAAVTGAIAGAMDQLAVLSTSATDLSATERDDLAAFAGALRGRLLHEALIGLLAEHYPRARQVLQLAGVIEQVEVAANAGLVLEHAEPRFRGDRLLTLFRDPWQLLREVYAWGEPDFDGVTLHHAVAVLVEQLGHEATVLEPLGLPAGVELYGMAMHTDPTVSPPGLAISIRQPLAVTVATGDSLGPWQGAVAITATVPVDVDLAVRPPLTVNLATPAVTAVLDVAIGGARHAGGEPLLVVGAVGASRIEFDELVAGLAVSGSWSDPTAAVALTPRLELS
ncbi:MAG: hypothetical protein IPL61_36455 [Myxococcales bacterium]|nr:hypothetical protein [Myxococcales bacterium]